MQSGLYEKARNLGRPLSSFRQRDMSLNEAQPSVLSQASRDAEASGATQKVIRTISAPRTVYSRFGDAKATGDSQFSSGWTSPNSNSHAIGSTACVDLLSAPINEELNDIARPQKVQFQDSRNQVTMYTPSPTASTSPTAAHFTSPNQQLSAEYSHHDSWSMESVTRTQLAQHEEGGISRCASNLASRAGTFDEIIAEARGPKAVTPQAFDAKISGVISQMAYQKISARTSNTVAAMSSPENDSPPSRCASNMTARAGTFDEIVADQVIAHPLSLVDSLMGDYSMLSNASLTSQQPSRCPPTRRVSNMMSSAGIFNDVLDFTEDAVDKELFDGTISRRATNMHTAAGAFEELVDEDGDELDPEQHSCSSLASEDAEITNLSLSGLVSDTDFLQASAAAGEHVPLISLRDDTQPSPQHHGRRPRGGCESVTRFAPPTLVEHVGDNWELVMGMLPSDACAEVDESGQRNPHATVSGPADACKLDTQCDRSHQSQIHNTVALGPEQTDTAWVPQNQQTCTIDQSPASDDLLKFSGSYSQDRLSVVQKQVESLSIDEQQILLATLSARVNTVASPPVDTSSLTTHLSIHTPHRTLTKFTLDEEAEEIISGPLVSSGLHLQKTISSRGMTVRTPRAQYDVVFAGDENAGLPSAMAAIEDKQSDRQSGASRAILTPMEWSLKVARKPISGSNMGALGVQVPPSRGVQGKVLVQPASPFSADCTTRLVAYRPDGHDHSVWAADH